MVVIECLEAYASTTRCTVSRTVGMPCFAKLVERTWRLRCVSSTADTTSLHLTPHLLYPLILLFNSLPQLLLLCVDRLLPALYFVLQIHQQKLI